MQNRVQTGNRVTCFSKNQQPMEERGPNFLSLVVKADESWFHHHEPLAPRASLEWVPVEERSRATSPQARFVGKLPFDFFWDSREIRFQEYLHLGGTITGPKYTNQMRQLQQPFVN